MVILWQLVSTIVAARGAESINDKPAASLQSFSFVESAKPQLLASGAVIYADKCASCHGDMGQGISGAYENPLVGDRSIAELASIIDRTMPEDEAELCQGEDALAAAIFAFETFYSEDAQLRNQPPRPALARLTTNQYRQNLSDLYTFFRGRSVPDGERGLHGIYFNHAGWRDNKKAFERNDALIDFDYGEDSPGEGIEAKEFGIYWSGGIMVPETGRYEIVARGMGSFKVDFIDSTEPFFDNHVQSGDVAEYKQSVELVGGRIYPINVEFIKRERKTGNVTAQFTLAWRPPHGVEQPIPTRYLYPGWTEQSFAPQTLLPPDDRSAGYERGSTISREWDEATTNGAIEFADVVSSRLWPWYRKERGKENGGEASDRDLLRQFGCQLIDMAFRCPTSEELRKQYVDDQLAATTDDDEAVRRIVILALKSPRFLYPAAAPIQSDDFRLASRLALTMWDSIPDVELRNAAQDGTLHGDDAVRQYARRMLDDPRALAKTMAALHHWLNLSRIGEVSKSSELFPNFNDPLVADLRASLDLFLQSVVQSEASDFRQLIGADWSYTSDRIAEFYGESWRPTGEQSIDRFSRTTADPQLRCGVITHPLVLSALAYNDTTSPIHRGVFLTRHLLGRVLRAPPEAFPPLSPDLHVDLTTRERVALQTSPETCQACHITINRLGFGLEQFDAVGIWRDLEKEKPIDSSGGYIDRSGRSHEFNGARELANYLINSDDAQSAFINRMFLHFVKQPPAVYGTQTMADLKAAFQQSEFNIRELIVNIAVVAAKGATTIQ